MDPLPRLTDDGLLTPEVGDWAEEKYQHVRYYADLFARSMSKKWKNRAYVDLFAGAGRSRIRGMTSILPASPTIALGLPFTRYVFCEGDPKKLYALTQRRRRDFDKSRAWFVSGDVNEATDEILAQLPVPSDGGLLTFCLVDPYAMSNLRFETIRRLSERWIDFLVLVPSGQDFQRWREEKYMDPADRVVEEFLGDPNWRKAWHVFPKQDRKNGASEFIADRFGQQMASLGFIYKGLDVARVVRSTDKNLLLYHLLLFSRKELGASFWKTTLDNVNPQRELGF
ncbi:MAG: three-Cys-motif partner protein TcmP [Thermoanaerobaculia bacterium]